MFYSEFILDKLGYDVIFIAKLTWDYWS